MDKTRQGPAGETSTRQGADGGARRSEDETLAAELKRYQVTGKELAGQTIAGPLGSYIAFVSSGTFELVTRNTEATYRGSYTIERNAENMSVIRIQYRSKTGAQKAAYRFARDTSGTVTLTIDDRTEEDLPAWFTSK
jgi:hypothetical protein